MANNDTVILLESFVAEEKGELSALQGEIVRVLEEDVGGWTYVQNQEGSTGLVPSSFTAPVPAEPESSPLMKRVSRSPGPTSPREVAVSPLSQEVSPREVEVSPEEPEGKSESPVPELSLEATKGKRRSVGKLLSRLSISPRASTADEITRPSPNMVISGPTEASAPSARASVAPAAPTSMKSPRSGQPIPEAPPVIIRVYTNQDIQKEIDEKDLADPSVLRTFKSIRATAHTNAKYVVDEVAKKLLLADTRLFQLFAIDRKAMTMRLVREDERPVEILRGVGDEIHFALVYSPKISAKIARDVKAKGVVRWDVEPGELTHRRLLNDTVYSKFSDLTINVGTAPEVSTFKAIVEVRFPALLSVDPSLVKKKKEKNMAHGVAEWIRFHDGLFTQEIFYQMFDYMYTGQLEFVHLDLEKVIAIYVAANKLKYDSLAQYCRAYFDSQIGLHNVFLALKWTHEAKADDLKEFVINFCLNNWQTISSSKEGLTIIGLELFQEITVVKAGMNSTPPLMEPTDAPENTVIQDFQRIRSLMHFADAVSVFGNLILPYHRCILAAASPKFLAMFIKEAGSGKKKLPRYSFDSISGGAFKGLIDLVYSGTTDITPNEACELLEHIAVQFELDSVRQDCEALICQHERITLDNVMNILRITYLKCNVGRAHLTITARKHCLAFICANFRDIDMSELKKFDSATAWELLEMLHSRFNNHKLVGLN